MGRTKSCCGKKSVTGPKPIHLGLAHLCPHSVDASSEQSWPHRLDTLMVLGRWQWSSAGSSPWGPKLRSLVRSLGEASLGDHSGNWVCFLCHPCIHLAPTKGDFPLCGLLPGHYGVCSPCSSLSSRPTQDSPEPPSWGMWKAQISSLPCGSQRRPGDVRGWLRPSLLNQQTTLPFLFSCGPPVLM